MTICLLIFLKHVEILLVLFVLSLLIKRSAFYFGLLYLFLVLGEKWDMLF